VTTAEVEPATDVSCAECGVPLSDLGSTLVMEGRTWTVPERFTLREIFLLAYHSRARTWNGDLSRAILAGDPDACCAFALVLLRRDDPAATIGDARHALGVDG